MMGKLLYSFFFCIVLFSFKAAWSQEVDHEEGFNYDKDAVRGPTHWGDLKPEWQKCKTGLMQSPIDLLHKRVAVITNLGDIKFVYKPSNATLANRGHDIMMKWVSEAGHIRIGGTRYRLKQCHWHSPSEHTIDGKKFDLEAHLVHQSSNGTIAAVGILYQIGEPNPFLSTIMDHLKALSKTNGEEREIGIIDPNSMKIDSKQYYRYMGSLTIPPCTENVTWTVIHEVKTVGEEQVKLLRISTHDNSNVNARPVQPIHDRTMKLKIPDDL